MLQAEAQWLTASRDLYLAIVRENPDLRIERRSNGALTVVPPTGGDAGRRNVEPTVQLALWNRGRDDAGVVFDSSTGFDLPDGSTLSPDAAWISAERWNALTAAEQRRFPPLCPDFVAELLSPSDDLIATRSKLRDFIRNGAQLGWLIDPRRRVVEIYRPGREAETLQNPQLLDAGDPLTGFVLNASALLD
jgi:Uma2 family endonuclease